MWHELVLNTFQICMESCQKRKANKKKPHSGIKSSIFYSSIYFSVNKTVDKEIGMSSFITITISNNMNEQKTIVQQRQLNQSKQLPLVMLVTRYTSERNPLPEKLTNIIQHWAVQNQMIYYFLLQTFSLWRTTTQERFHELQHVSFPFKNCRVIWLPLCSKLH